MDQRMIRKFEDQRIMDLGGKSLPEASLVSRSCLETLEANLDLGSNILFYATRIEHKKIK